ncbi:SIR2 family protein [Gordonia sp. PDNC005]|uniref:SIR2 family protein n=1 Tax=Gordonia sp. PDNC005 TaxID=2811424 RepID=UPI001965712F|nr:SIR2 family protein [Gordonia sp. PDNC005]QRY63419.1 SIR2 family protein [Gordonia sp. PDNC005]
MTVDAAEDAALAQAAGNYALRGRNARWSELEPSRTDGPADPLAGYEQKQVQEELLRCLNSESLSILTGLGTSLGIPPNSGAKAPTMWDLWNSVAALPEFSSIEPQTPQDILNSQNIEHLLSHVQARINVHPIDATLARFLQNAQAIILASCSFIDSDSELDVHELFLRKVGRRSPRHERTKLFTTNYDLAFEVAAARSRFHFIDGFANSTINEFDASLFDLDFVRRGSNGNISLEGNVLHLLKLHGSVNWDGHASETRRTSTSPATPVLIYPSANKYQMSFRQPYLEMMSRFQIALRQPNSALIVSGFGFNDEHIVAPIESAVRGNVGLRLVVVDPNIRNEQKRSEFLTWLERLALAGDHRITLVEGTFSDLVRLLPDSAEYDERQAHADRIQRTEQGGS